jgi:hypothetical protein
VERAGNRKSQPERLTKPTGAFMPAASGELIRSMNYVDDITTTLRRICIYIPSMTPEERQRLAEYLRAAGGAINSAIADLEKVSQ